MKLSLQLAQSTTETDITSIGAKSIVTKIGAQLGAVEDVVEWSARYKNIVIAKVVQCSKHPNADKLSICLIDDGGKVEDVSRDDNGLVQVVCGAPNVREGLLVVWLPPGSVVPATIDDADPFLLGARELRGVVSNGMLASPSELGISDNHDGILEVDQDVLPGTLFAKAYHLDDTIIDLENKMFTHRPDCFGIIGVARELAGIQRKQYKSSDWYMHEPQFSSSNVKQLKVDVKTDLVPRFSAVAVDSVAVTPSPIWMQVALTKLDIRPINNIVDITNLLMYMTGQPLHAYDYDKVISKAKNNQAILHVRQSQKGDALLLLNGKTVEFNDDTTVLICADDAPIGVGGVMGGADTEIDESTKTIILEAASFDMYSIRKTSMKYGLFTDAVTRFNKGQSPLQTTRVLARALEMVQEIAGGKQASDLCDYADSTVKPLPNVVLNVDFINDRLGTNLSASDIATLLNNVECQTVVEDSKITVSIPFWRRDLHVPEDIVEEVGRLYGFDTLPIILPPRTSTATQRNEFVDFKYRLRSLLAAAGANEVLTYSFVHKKTLEAAQQNIDNALQLSNAISPDLQFYRLSITPSLLDKVHMNIKAGHGSFALYELGKAHSKKWRDDDGLPIEAHRLAFVFAADTKIQKEFEGEPYYQARVFLDMIAKKLNITLHYEAFSDDNRAITTSDTAQPFLPSRSAIVTTDDGETLGVIGEYITSEVQACKLPVFCAGFELELEQLYSASKYAASTYVPLPKFPKTMQDITLAVSADVLFSQVQRVLSDALQRLCPQDSYYELNPVDIYKSKDGSVHYTFRLNISNYNHTLTAKEVNELLESVALDAKNSIGAVRK